MSYKCQYCGKILATEMFDSEDIRHEIMFHAEESIDCLYAHEERREQFGQLVEIVYKYNFCFSDVEAEDIADIEIIDIDNYDNIYIDVDDVDAETIAKLTRLCDKHRYDVAVVPCEFIASDGNFRNNKTIYAVTEDGHLAIFSDDGVYWGQDYWIDDLLSSYIVFRHPQRILDALKSVEADSGYEINEDSIIISTNPRCDDSFDPDFQSIIASELSSVFTGEECHVLYYNVIAHEVIDNVYYAVRQGYSRWQGAADYTTETLGVITPEDGFPVMFLDEINALLVYCVDPGDEDRYKALAILDFDVISQFDYKGVIKREMARRRVKQGKHYA